MSERFDCLRSLASQDYGAKTIARPPDSQETKTGELPLSWGMFQKNDFRERRTSFRRLPLDPATS